ncbi:cytochrome P450 monooxygenase [Aspergillus granulosus]|uniref:Cytochrome P450 monooxygenase n=1 Tax=Aspergillus granulosus TaxID=176169 RepID=A0ABR4GVQ9_9EURO
MWHVFDIDIVQSSEWNAFVGAFTSGIFLHQGLFKHGEWHLYGFEIIVAYFISLVSVMVLSIRLPGMIGGISPTPGLVIRLGLYHFAGIFTSLTTYRVFLHPLEHFPGPFLARFSSLYKMHLSWNLKLFEETKRLHCQYGDIIRLGPCELSIANPAAIKAIHWPQTAVRKGPIYDQTRPRVNLENTRDPIEHARLRKIWDRAFNTKALRDYSPRTFNITQWFNYYSFDVMGDLAFGKSFEMLQGGTDHYILSTSHQSMEAAGYLGTVSWSFPLVMRIPGLNRGPQHFWNFISDQVRSRMENPPDLPDIFHWLLQGYTDRTNTAERMAALESEAELAVIAGSDTTSATLANATFELLSHPENVDKLRAEFDDMDLAKLPHLNAVINEILRLHPPVPSGLPRQTPLEGLTIDETYIPGNMNIQIPFHTVFRDKRCFKRPQEFLPERWTSQLELIHDASAFIPFSIGTYSCVGKQLALMEVRWVLTMIITQYDMKFAPEYDVQEFCEGEIDGFTSISGPLFVQLSRRGIA